MAIRVRSGKWHYRFTENGHEYSASTGLVGTERNRAAAQRAEAEAYKLVVQGRAAELHIQTTPFSKGADMFLAWVKGEYQAHPNSAARIRGSFASLRQFFGNTPVHTITTGQIEDYKSWRRTSEVKDFTLRNDLHNLSLFFQYAEKHGWRRDNPVRKVEMPSAGESDAIHVLTAEEERVYFEACRLGWCEQKESGRKVKHGPFPDLHDLGRLMLNQGCRPEELLSLPWDQVDFQAGMVKIGRSKTTAGRRILRLTPESLMLLAARMAQAVADSGQGAILPSLEVVQHPGNAPRGCNAIVHPPKWVFPSPTRPGRHIIKLNNSHDELLEHAGLKFRIYDFRHTFATKSAQSKKVDLGTLARILGHSNLRTVMRYIHPSQEHMNEAMERLGELHGKTSGSDRDEVRSVDRPTVN
jgi:integrase